MDDANLFSSEDLPYPDFFNFADFTGEAIMLYSSAAFIRNSGNTNIEYNIPIGPDISPGTVWFSPNIYLNSGTFNLIRPIDEIIYPDNKDAMILKDLTFLHDIFIQYKMTKSDGTNFSNQREIRCTIVRVDGTTPYEPSFFANNQPDSGNHDYIQMRGHIVHNLSDIVKIKLNIVQDNRFGDQSDTKLTIFRISWNILGLTK